MKTKLIILYVFICLYSISCTTQNYPIRFGVIADIQYCDCDTRGSRFYRNSLSKLENCVNDLNQQKVEFTVNLGDLVDRDTEANLDAIVQRLNKLDNPLYNTTGNHDYEGVKDNDALYKKLNMSAAYYSFKKEKWRFIMLNTNEIASYVTSEDTQKEELASMKQRIKEEGRKNGASYNGGISKKQLNWLESELQKAQENKENVIILSHHPLYAAVGLTALNDLEILDVLSNYPCVKLSISGHHHPGDYGIYKGIHFITTEGMIETENENAYAVVDIYTDKIDFRGKGRTKSYTINL